MVIKLISSMLKGGWKLTWVLFWGGLWIWAVVLLIWYPLRWWPGDRVWPIRLLNYFVPWLLIGLIPSLLLAWAARRKRLALMLAGPTLLIVLTYAPLFLPRSDVALAGSHSFTVMSYNIWARNQNLEAAAALIRQEQPDILLLQEVSPKIASFVQTSLADLYPDGPLYVAYEPDLGQATLSRYPLTSLGATYSKGRTQKVRVELLDGSVEVWNIHPHAPLPWQRQYREISSLVEDIAAVDGPLIVGGDFNTTDQAETYRLIDQHLSNAHWESGWGFGFSYPSSVLQFRGKLSIPSLIRIDHIFYSDYFHAIRAGTLSNSAGSDHFPVVAEFTWAR